MRTTQLNESLSRTGGSQAHGNFGPSKTPIDRSHFGGLNDTQTGMQTRTHSLHNFKDVSSSVMDKMLSSAFGGIVGVTQGEAITYNQRSIMIRYYRLWMVICIVTTFLYYYFVIKPITVVQNLVPAIPYVFHGYKVPLTFYPSNHGYDVYVCKHVQQLSDEFSIKNGPRDTKVIKINETELQETIGNQKLDLIANVTGGSYRKIRVWDGPPEPNVSGEIKTTKITNGDANIEDKEHAYHDLWDASKDEQEVGNQIQLKFYDEFKSYGFTVTGFTSFYLEIIDLANESQEHKLQNTYNQYSDVEILQNGQKLKSNHFTCTNDQCQFTVIPKRENMDIQLRLHTLKLDVRECIPIQKSIINYLGHPERNYCQFYRVGKIIDKPKIVFQPVESNMYWGISQNSYIEVYRFAKIRPVINLIVIAMIHFGTFVLTSAMIHWKMSQAPKLKSESKSFLRTPGGVNTTKSFAKSSFKF